MRRVNKSYAWFHCLSDWFDETARNDITVCNLISDEQLRPSLEYFASVHTSSRLYLFSRTLILFSGSRDIIRSHEVDCKSSRIGFVVIEPRSLSFSFAHLRRTRARRVSSPQDEECEKQKLTQSSGRGSEMGMNGGVSLSERRIAKKKRENGRRGERESQKKRDGGRDAEWFGRWSAEGMKDT